jgi:hypothetical protein
MTGSKSMSAFTISKLYTTVKIKELEGVPPTSQIKGVNNLIQFNKIIHKKIKSTLKNPLMKLKGIVCKLDYNFWFNSVITRS